ncbi:hypothetical protein K8R33_05205 [archaeon]|nr:hypothetical protein [archaeon]
MPEDVKNLLLSEVQNNNPSGYSRCKVRYSGIAGEGRDWAYRAGGDPFEFEITPAQANLLSRLQDSMQRRLTEPELELMVDIPATLKNRTGDGSFHVTGSAQVAQYDLLR